MQSCLEVLLLALPDEINFFGLESKIGDLV